MPNSSTENVSRSLGETCCMRVTKVCVAAMLPLACSVGGRAFHWSQIAW